MIIKTIGGAFIFLASYLFGVLKYKELLKRLEILKVFKNDISYFKNSIEFSKMPLCEMISEKKNDTTVLKSLYAKFCDCKQNYDVEKAWEVSVDEFGVHDTYKKLFYKFSDFFSAMDINGQCSMFASYINCIDTEINNLEAYIKKNDKLYKNIGLYAGILIIVLLM